MGKMMRQHSVVAAIARVCLTALFTAVLLAGFAAPTLAALPPVKGHVSYNLNDKPLKDFLQEFFAGQGLGVMVSPAVAAQGGTLNGPREGSAAEVLRQILRSNDLAAYYDGAQVYIYKNSEKQTRYTSLPPAKVEEFARTFANMRLGDADDTFTATAGSGMVMFSGTPRFAEQAQQLANTVASSAGVGGTGVTPTIFKYYPLRYALAADTTMTVGDRQISVPGVASLLRQLVGTEPAGGSFSGSQERLLPRMQPNLRGQGLARVGQPPLAPPPDYSQAGGQDYTAQDNGDAMAQAQTIPAPGQPDVRIVADTYRNAVIVRDTPDRMPMYDELIKTLDVDSPMVEIEATIIDIDKDKLKKYGINFFYRNNGGRLGIGFNESPGSATNLVTTLMAGTIDKLLPVMGFQLGAIIGDSAKFITRIDALETDGITDVITRPQVITLNDVEAVIESTQTIYVPVAGAYNTDLFNVVAGTVLRVTPHVIYENGERHIRMVVQIEDGNVTLQGNYAGLGAVPVVSRKAVNTQAIINQGQSLLLGGLNSDSLLNNQTKIPILGDIPLIKYLFRDVQKERDHHERLFLITPRLVSADQVTQQQVRSAPNVSPEEVYNNQQKVDHKSYMGKPDQEPLPPQSPPPPPPSLAPPQAALPPPQPVMAAPPAPINTPSANASVPPASGQTTVNSAPPAPSDYGPKPDFSQLDSNHDGTISEQESEAYPPLENDWLHVAKHKSRISKSDYAMWDSGDR